MADSFRAVQALMMKKFGSGAVHFDETATFSGCGVRYKKFVTDRQWPDPTDRNGQCLTSELGELCEAILREDRNNFNEELCDFLCFVMRLAANCNVDLFNASCEAVAGMESLLPNDNDWATVNKAVNKAVLVLMSSLPGDNDWATVNKAVLVLMCLNGKINDIFRNRNTRLEYLGDCSQRDDKLFHELFGQVMCMIIALATYAGMDLPKAAMDKLKANEEKYPVEEYLGRPRKYNEPRECDKPQERDGPRERDESPEYIETNL